MGRAFVYILLCSSLVFSELQRIVADIEYPKFTVFACPKPFTLITNDPQHVSSDNQLRALHSWLSLKSKPKVVLMGKDISLQQIADLHPGVSVEPEIDENFRGMPMFGAIVYRSLYGDGDFSVLLNSDILLFDDFVDVTMKSRARFANFVATAARWDVPSWPFVVAGRNGSTSEPGFVTYGGAPVQLSDVKSFVQSVGVMHAYGGTDVWVWNKNVTEAGKPLPLFAGKMPPFVYARGKNDNWFNHEIENTGVRALVDISLVAATIHVRHGHDHVGVQATKPAAEAATAAKGRHLMNFWSNNKKTSWEQYLNIVNGYTHGTYKNQLGTVFHASWKFEPCNEPAANNMCLIKRTRPAKCGCEYSPETPATDKDPGKSGNVYTCGALSVDRLEEFEVSGRIPVDRPAYPGLPHTLDQLLPKLADASKTVVMTALLGDYGAFLMNFVCQLRKVGIANVLVAAFDDEAYRFGFLNGLSVFLADRMAINSNSTCHLESRCLRAVSRAKSAAVIQVLEMGYNVLFSDVDVVWFQNPLAELQQLSSQGQILAQSNEPDAEKPANGKRRFSTSFYFAPSTAPVINALYAALDKFETSGIPEQAAFYDVLCGEGRKYAVGDDQCTTPEGVTTVFLPRDAFPNGAHKAIWNASDVAQTAGQMGCRILHNNWVTVASAKVARQKMFWHYEADLETCKYSWLK